VDEALQTFGGYGYSQEYPVERFYRDSRINRIFEGTNEINRLLAAGMILKRAGQGRLPLLPAMKAAQEAILAPPEPPASDEGPLGPEAERVHQGRQATLLLAGMAFQKHGERLADEQEVLAGLSDLILNLFAAESALLRAAGALTRGGPKAATAADLARAAVAEEVAALEATARRLLPSLAEGDALRSSAAALRKVLRAHPPDLVALHRKSAAATLAAAGYPLA
jgi:alkylation response protein AidB-like acyl-CoA dehydrogenase